MIAKRILAPQGGSGFQRLSGYVLNVAPAHRAATDPASWTRLGAYVLDTQHDGEKVAWARATNCGSDDPGWAVKDILAIQAQNTRSTSDRSYHLVVSFPEGERPTREQIEDIEDRLCEAIGFGEHQRVSAVHQNTDNWHLHVAVNKVHPTSLRNVAPHRDHYRLQEACVELEIRHGLTQETHTINREQGRDRRVRATTAAFETDHGGQSFLAWTREHAGAALLDARDTGGGWQAVHEVAGSLGLVVKLRGAGLVVSHRADHRLQAKASEVDPGLSFKAMTDRLGEFERPAPSGDLYNAFTHERMLAIRARDAAVAGLAAQHTAYERELADWYRQRLEGEKAQGLKGVLRRDSVQHVIGQREADRAARIKRERQERQQVRDAHKFPTWAGYLEAEAAKGSEAALAALRLRQRRTQQIEAKILTADNAEQARHVIHQHMRPTVRRDGRVVYQVADGGVVSDEAAQVRVPMPTVASAFLALSLAAERFGARPLVVKGSDEFRRQIAAVAGIEGLSVSFADPGMERERVRSAGETKVVDQGKKQADTIHYVTRADHGEDRSR